MKTINNREKLQESMQKALLGKLNEDSEVVVEKTVQLPMNLVIEEAIKQMSERTSVQLRYIKNNDATVEFEIDGDVNHIDAFKDIYGLDKDNQSLSEDSALNKLKRQVEDIFNSMEVDYNYKLKRSSSDEDIMWFTFEVEVKDIPYPITLKYSVYSSGEMKILVSCYGNKEKNESWYIPCYSLKSAMESVYGIISYFKSQPKEIEGE